MSNVNKYNYQQIHDRRLAESICVAAVVSVTAFDPAKMTVDVQPLSKHLQNGKYESQPPILSIPVACTRSGGFIIRPWIKAGDTGVVVYLDHDMDSTVSGGKEAEPLTERNHATTDAIFVGGIVSGSYMVQGFPGESLVLSTDDGSVYAAVTKSGVKITGDVEVTGTITVTDDIIAESDVKIAGNAEVTGTITAADDIIAESDVKIAGNAEVTGTITAADDIITESDVKIAGDVEVAGKITAADDIIAESSISSAHHTHPGCSGGATGQPM